jgi:hypothetical protein
MEKKVLSFEDFSAKKSDLGYNNTGKEIQTNAQNESHEQEKNYMFFQNLNTVKHYLEEIMAMDKNSVDSILSNGHDWASDHLATAKDDIEEVCNFIRNEVEMNGAHSMEAPEIQDEPEISTDLEMIETPDSEESRVETEIEDEEDDNEEEEEEYEENEEAEEEEDEE